MATSRPRQDVAEVDYKSLHVGHLYDRDSPLWPENMYQCAGLVFYMLH